MISVEVINIPDFVEHVKLLDLVLLVHVEFDLGEPPSLVGGVVAELGGVDADLLGLGEGDPVVVPVVGWGHWVLAGY